MMITPFAEAVEASAHKRTAVRSRIGGFIAKSPQTGPVISAGRASSWRGAPRAGSYHIGRGMADRVPLELAGCQFASRADIEAHPDPLRRKVAHRIFDESPFTVPVPNPINRYLITPPRRIRRTAENLPNGHTRTRGTIDTPGGELTFITEVSPASGTSWTVKYPVESEADIEKIASVPWELLGGLAPPDTGGLPDGFDERGILETRISSPFVCVAGMMDYQWFLELCLTHPGLIIQLTEICLQRTMDILEVLFSRTGIEYVWMGGSEWITPPMASPAIYDALDHRYLNEVPGLEISTCEKISAWIWNRLVAQDLKPTIVVIQETPTARCLYYGE